MDPEKNPLDRDPRTKKQIKAYREKERARQKLLRDMRQHKEYRAALGKNIPKDEPIFKKLLEKGEGSNVSMRLSDGIKVSCYFEMLTYANKPGDEDSDIMVASVQYHDGYGELLAAEDILEVY